MFVVHKKMSHNVKGKRMARSRKAPANKKKRLQNKNLDRRIKKLEHSEELKYIDIYNTSALTNTGTIVALNFIAQGDDFNQRLGEEICAKFVNMKIRISHLAAGTYDQVRSILFWDKQTNGTGPTIYTSTDINSGLLDNSTITSGVLCPHNYRCNDRYAILYDKVHSINPESSAVDKVIQFKKSFKLSGAKVKYSNSGALITSIPSRSLFYVQISYAPIASTTPTNSFRFWYTDA